MIKCFFFFKLRKKFNFLKLIFNTVDEMKNYQRLPSSFFNKQDEFQQQKMFTVKNVNSPINHFLPKNVIIFINFSFQCKGKHKMKNDQIHTLFISNFYKQFINARKLPLQDIYHPLFFIFLRVEYTKLSKDAS